MTINVTRTELVIRGVAYFALGLAGPWVILQPPPTMTGSWGSIYVITWGMLLFPAMIASVSSFCARFRVEMIVLPWITAGLFLNAAALWYMTPPTPAWGAIALVTTSFCLMLVNRYMALMRLSRTSAPHTDSIPKVPRKGSS